jgi:Carboxypeptidase regulatory-like domain/PQQ-like domain
VNGTWPVLLTLKAHSSTQAINKRCPNKIRLVFATLFLIFLSSSSAIVPLAPVRFAVADAGPLFTLSPSSQNLIFGTLDQQNLLAVINITNIGDQAGRYELDFSPSIESLGVTENYYTTVIGPGQTSPIWINININNPIAIPNGSAYSINATVYAISGFDGPGQRLRSNLDAFSTINIVVHQGSESLHQITGNVIDSETGAPIAGALVMYSLWSNRQNGGDAITTSNGSYSTMLTEGGPYTVNVQAVGYLSHDETGFYLTKDTSKNIVLQESSNIGNYSLSWEFRTDNPIYEGMISQNSKYIVVAEGEHPVAGFHAQAVSNFSDFYHLYYFNINGTLIWKSNAILVNGSVPLADGGIWGLDMTNDGSLVAASTTDGKIMVYNRQGLLWNTTVNFNLPAYEQNGTYNSRGVKFSPDGKYLVAEGRGIVCFSATTGKLLWTLGSNDTGSDRSFVFSSDGSRLLFGGELLTLVYTSNGSIIWQTPIDSFPFSNWALSATPNLSVIVAGGKGSRLFVLNGDGTYRFSYTNTVLVNWDGITNDGSLIADGDRGFLRLFKNDGTMLWQQRVGDTTGGMITPDGKYILASTMGSELYGFNGFTGGASTDITQGYMPNGLRLFDTNGALIWKIDWNTNATKWVPTELAQARFAAITPDFKYIVSGSTDNYLRVYEGSILPNSHIASVVTSSSASSSSLQTSMSTLYKSTSSNVTTTSHDTTTSSTITSQTSTSLNNYMIIGAALAVSVVALGSAVLLRRRR